MSASMHPPGHYRESGPGRPLPEDRIAAILDAGGGASPPRGRYTVVSEEIDLKIQLSEARTDTKFAELIGEIKAFRAEVAGRFEKLEDRTAGIKTTVIGTGIAAVAIVIGVIAWGGDMFGRGFDASDIADKAAERAVRILPPPPAALPGNDPLGIRPPAVAPPAKTN